MSTRRYCGLEGMTFRHRVVIPVLSAVVPAVTFLLLLGGVAPAAQDTQGPLSPVAALRGSLERITVHGTSLEGNLEGDAPDRSVTVYLPPSYTASAGRRYPAIVSHSIASTTTRTKPMSQPSVERRIQLRASPCADSCTDTTSA